MSFLSDSLRMWIPPIPSRIYEGSSETTLPVLFALGKEIRKKVFRLKKGLNTLVFLGRDAEGRKGPLEIRLVEMAAWEEGPITSKFRQVTFACGLRTCSFDVPRCLEEDFPVLRLISEFLFGDWDPELPAARKQGSLLLARYGFVKQCLQEACAA